MTNHFKQLFAHTQHNRARNASSFAPEGVILGRSGESPTHNLVRIIIQIHEHHLLHGLIIVLYISFLFCKRDIIQISREAQISPWLLSTPVFHLKAGFWAMNVSQLIQGTSQTDRSPFADINIFYAQRHSIYSFLL
jgi:hypothetical protein